MSTTRRDGVEVAQVEEMVKRLSDQKGVLGVIIANGEGTPIRSTMEPEQTVQYSGLAAALARQARSLVREVAPDDDLQFLRLRSNGREIMIAPQFDKDSQLSLMVVQDPAPEASQT